MQTYNGWTLYRDYQTWAGEEPWAGAELYYDGVTYRVEPSGDDDVYETTRKADAHEHAMSLLSEYESEAQSDCASRCGQTPEECGEAYNKPHCVQSSVYDYEEGRSLESFEL